MASVDDTAKLANVKRSIRKFFVANLYDTEGKEIVFDKWMSIPDVLNMASTVNEWYSINFGALEVANMSDMEVTVFCCTQNDDNNLKLEALRDILFAYLRDSDRLDGIRRISFLNQSDTVIGGLMIVNILESGDLEGEDGTKYYSLTCQIRFASKV